MGDYGIILYFLIAVYMSVFVVHFAYINFAFM